ncbi:MAG TPA: cysteine peptidase family C39 domain-containing protein [Anaerolineae bacterium]
MPVESFSKTRRRRRDFPPLQRLYQVSESHCGPAVLQILLARLGIEVDQDRLTELAGARESIETHGTRVDQLALAVRRLAGGVRFWFKDHATVEELVAVVSRYHYPAGVEWQGLFEDREEDEDAEADYGHYSIVTAIDRRRGLVRIQDPYKAFYTQDRVFSISWFAARWWDTNEILDPASGQPRVVEDYHAMFIVTPPRVRFPLLLGMKEI